MGAAADAIVAYSGAHADLTVLECGATALQEAAFESALFRSGRPVLLLPKGWRGQTLGKRILLAWNGKREAARALADAEAFFEDADSIHVVTVDGIAPFEGAEEPGVEIAAHLARHGLNVELRQVESAGRAAEAVLVDEARGVGADMMVLGGFGHSRFRQFVFGGVTRALSRSAPLPLPIKAATCTRSRGRVRRGEADVQVSNGRRARCFPVGVRPRFVTRRA
jgi:nucleotide-binding universal stress UspA family protein